jgi:hypothetical protein
MNKKIIILTTFALMHTNNSLGMLRALAKNTIQSPAPKYARPIMMKFTPEQAKEALKESHRVNGWYDLGLKRNKILSPKNKTTRLLLQTQTPFIENIQRLNNENIKTLQAKNSTEEYNVNDFTQQIELLEFLENELADRGLFQ